MEIPLLTCKICGETKENFHFLKMCNRSNRLQNTCKDCNKKRNKKKEIEILREKLPGSKYSNW